jgi:DNA replication and repair protein RecF
MYLKKLDIKDFRNLASVEMQPSSGINLITGENAAGKTSLLEAIYYLCHTRSFRSQQVSDLIRREADYLQLVAMLHTNTAEIPVGIRRSKTRLKIRLNQQDVKRAAELAAKFPVLAIHPDSYKLINGSPVERRQYLDWGVFHVEQGFFAAWQRYRKALAQRNAALKKRQSPVLCALWDKELSEAANHIDAMRRRYYEALLPFFAALVQRFFPSQSVSIVYRRGWPAEQSLPELLSQQLEHDRQKGFSYYGPHRAELAIRVAGQSAQNGISRGQQKTLVAVLRLAQAQQLTAVSKQACILLYDDLAAELDVKNRNQILAVLADMNIQLFVTAISAEQIDSSAWQHKKMFHVEQGVLRELI